MKQSTFRPAGKPSTATTRRWDQPRSRILDLDDDILGPASHQPVMRQPAPVSNPPAGGAAIPAKTAISASAGAGRTPSRAVPDAAQRAPRNPAPQPDPTPLGIEPQRLKAHLSAAAARIARLEKTVEEQSAKLSACHDQILDLSNKRDQQAHELNAAREAMEGMERSVAAAREAATVREAERDAELAAANEKLGASEQDKLALQDKLAATQAQVTAAHRDFMQASDKLLASETALNDQNAATAAAWENVDRVNAELEQSKADNATLEAELKGAKEQRRALDEQTQKLRGEIETLKAAGQQSAREAETAAMDRAVLQQRCEDLVRTVGLMLAARRKMSAELQGNVGDLGDLSAELARMRASHVSMAGKFEEAEIRLVKMRQQIVELDLSHTVLGKDEAGLSEAQPAEPGAAAEQGADIIKLETSGRGKKVA